MRESTLNVSCKIDLCRGSGILLSRGYSVSFTWSQQWDNVLDGASLFISEMAGDFLPHNIDGEPATIREVHAEFTRDMAGLCGWIERDNESVTVPTKRLADHYLNKVIDHSGDPPLCSSRRPDYLGF